MWVFVDSFHRIPVALVEGQSLADVQNRAGHFFTENQISIPLYRRKLIISIHGNLEPSHYPKRRTAAPLT